MTTIEDKCQALELIVIEMEQERAQLQKRLDLLLNATLFDWEYCRRNGKASIHFMPISMLFKGRCDFYPILFDNIVKHIDGDVVEYVDDASFLRIYLDNNEYTSMRNSRLNSVITMSRERADALIEYIDKWCKIESPDYIVSDV